ncbi:uncharacterized protein [Solanum tuberosum]|uniref:uncharacterized protein isoform X1 n=2 Tax=Solanum tuberosum TaxID=4113 RepID=UPI00073A3412|nr:PREDICTED: uncharacterized protein LOC102589243 isoform X1 [Solanum tuberosum]
MKIQPFLEEFSQIYSETSQQSSDVEWNRKFISWLQKKVDMNPSITLKYEMGQASKIPKHELIQPGALAKGLGQSLKSMSTIRVNAERRTPIAKNRSYYTSTSKLNKIADNSFHVHPCFEEKEDNAPLYQEAEMNQYTLTSDARGQGQSLRINAEKRTMIGENRNTTTTSSQNKPAKKSIPVPPDFNPMEDNDTLFLETEVTRDTQRSDHLQKSSFESRKAKEVVGVAQGSKGNQNSPVGYDKA